MKNRLIAILTIFSSIFTPFAQIPLAHAAFNSMLAPTNFTPSGYIQPKYDAFDHDYYRPLPDGEADPDTAPTAEISVFTDQNGLQSRSRGTTTTNFTFDGGNSSDNETPTNRLEFRWDFENDGVLDSYFSRGRTIQHIYKKAGTYTVKLEVLDTAGNISGAYTKLTVAQNTPPTPVFVSKIATGTEKTVFTFDTSRSRDDQYLASALLYRFDWNGDGKWDTKYDDKTVWNHRFDAVGSFNVVMEVKDTEGATATTSQKFTTNANSAPTAGFTIKNLEKSQGAGYLFDAAASSDAQTLHRNLQFRWDFNNNGPNDIVYDSDWSSSDRFYGHYAVAGNKVIKLEVKDADGLISSSYAKINVERQ